MNTVKLEKGKKEFKILMWGPERLVYVWTVSDQRIDDLVKEAVFTLKHSRPNEFIGFSVMRNITPQELERLKQEHEENKKITDST